MNFSIAAAIILLTSTANAVKPQNTGPPDAAISALQGDIVRLDANITVLASRLDEEDDTLRGLIDDADTAITTADIAISMLKSRLDTAETTISELTCCGDISALALRLEEAEATISGLTDLVRALTPTQSPSASPTVALVIPTERKVFVTSERYNGGAIGGIAGAHSKCQALAIEVELSGTFKAWLSNSTSSPAQDFDKSGGPFVMINGDIVANDWQDLITADGSGVFLNNSITINENGGSTGGQVWTGTDVNGMPSSGSGDFCIGWTSTSGSAQAGGSRDIYTDYLWTNERFMSCSYPLPLYCFEQ